MSGKTSQNKTEEEERRGKYKPWRAPQMRDRERKKQMKEKID